MDNTGNIINVTEYINNITQSPHLIIEYNHELALKFAEIQQFFNYYFISIIISAGILFLIIENETRILKIIPEKYYYYYYITRKTIIVMIICLALMALLTKAYS